VISVKCEHLVQYKQIASKGAQCECGRPVDLSRGRCSAYCDNCKRTQIRSEYEIGYVVQQSILVRPGTRGPPSKGRLAPIRREFVDYPTQFLSFAAAA
jgi:hypothetical protein